MEIGMLKSRIQICFNHEREDKGDFYYCSAVRSLTFKFADSEYYLGFIQNTKSIDRYFLYQEYILEAIFPSIEAPVFSDYQKKLENNNKFPICLGKKIIGEGIFLEWEFME